MATDERGAVRAELHSHTDHSDGALSPAELVEAAVEAGITALAVTDHDTVSAVAPARAAAAAAGSIELISGIEYSCRFDEREIHMLGLFVDESNPEVLGAAARARRYRADRAIEIGERLEELGAPIDVESVVEGTGAGSVGRPHLAAALVARGHVTSADEAFRRYLGVGKPAWVPKPTLPATEVVAIVQRAGGVAVLAHPASSRVADSAIVALAEHGLDGIEIRHPKHKRGQQQHLEELAGRLGLLRSSGSDFHGPGRGRSTLGEYAAPPEWVDALRRRAAAHRSRAGDDGPGPEVLGSRGEA